MTDGLRGRAGLSAGVWGSAGSWNELVAELAEGRERESFFIFFLVDLPVAE